MEMGLHGQSCHQFIIIIIIIIVVHI